MERKHPSIPFSMRTYWKANHNATLRNLARHSASLVELQEDTGALISFTRDEKVSLLKSSKTSHVSSKTTRVRSVGAAEHSPTSSSSGMKKKGGSR